jgi:hypothetical protein
MNPDLKNIIVSYYLTSLTSPATEYGELIFWADLPVPSTGPDGVQVPNPENWVQLPPVAKDNFGKLFTYLEGKVNKLLDPV